MSTQRRSRGAPGRAKGARASRGITRSVPRSPGANKRVERSFDDEKRADRWVDDCWRALQSNPFPGLPDADDYRGDASLLSNSPVGRHGQRSVVDLFSLLDEWFADSYTNNRRSNPDEAANYQTDVKAIKAFYAEPSRRINDVWLMSGRDVDAFLHFMAGDHYLPPEGLEAPPVRPIGADTPGAPREVTIREASELGGRSRSAIKSLLYRGRFPGAYRADGAHGPGSGVWMLPMADLLAAGVIRSDTSAIVPAGGRTMPPGTGLSRRTAGARLRVLRKALLYGISKHYLEHDPTAGKSALQPARALARKPPNTNKPLGILLAETKQVAACLSQTMAVALWTMRILGLRIAELLGLHVGDVGDFEDVGLICIVRQGGKSYRFRDEYLRLVTADEKEMLKTAASSRVLAIPHPLLELLRWYVDCYHRDPHTGFVDLDAPLFKGVRGRQLRATTFTTALTKAHRMVDLTYESRGYHISAHTYRHSLGGDITWDALAEDSLKAEILGHKLRASGIAPAVTALYTPALPVLEPKIHFARDYAAKISNEVGSLIPDDLATGVAARGYLVADVAEELHVARATVNRLVVAGKLEVIWDRDANRGIGARRVTSESVEKYKEWLAGQYTPAMAAQELAVPIEVLWELIRAGRIEATRIEGSNRYLVDRSSIAAFRPLRDDQLALHRRAMTVYRAAQVIGVSHSTARVLVVEGKLKLDAESDKAGVRYVTRESVELVKEERGRRRARIPSRIADSEGFVSQPEARARFDIGKGELLEAIDLGHVVRKDFGGRRFIELASLEAYAERRAQREGVPGAVVKTAPHVTGDSHTSRVTRAGRLHTAPAVELATPEWASTLDRASGYEHRRSSR